MELSTYKANARAYKAQVAARAAGVALAVVEVEVPAGGPEEAADEASPANKLPALKTAEGKVITVSNDAARHVCAQAPGCALYDAADAEGAAAIDEWCEFFAAKLDAPLRAWKLALRGRGECSEDDAKAAEEAFDAHLATLETRLAARTFLAADGDEFTLADVVGYCTLMELFALVYDKARQGKYGAVTRWFKTTRAHPDVKAVCGEGRLAKKAAKVGGAAKAPGGGGGGGAKPNKPKKDPKPAQKKKQPKKEGNQDGLTVTKEEDFGEWFSELVTKAEFLDYGPTGLRVSGCYILRPWAYEIWEAIRDFLDAEFKKRDVKNAYFPIFVTEKALNAEEDHVEGFAAEVAWVTRSGKSELDQPLAVRPTSETIMYPCYANWVRSHRDLPLKLNQWNNVVRWEFKHPTPFIRSREFLWQEGHTAYATEAEADVEALAYLELYRRTYEELCAVPVIKGVKSEKEKFAGAKYTTTVEGYIPFVGRGIQGATSHCLGQNFSKMFGIEFEDEKTKEKCYAWQNSFGLTTRTIGVMLMMHSDNKGAVLPPRVAPTQVVVIPIPFKDHQREQLVAKADEIAAQLKAAGVRVTVDARDNYTPGWKYNFYELKGVPLRLELGPKDMDKESVMTVRRDTGAKVPIAWKDLSGVPAMLETMQQEMLDSARRMMEASKVVVTKWEDFVPALDQKKFCMTPWCEDPESEEEVKVRSAAESDGGAAKTLCIPYDQPPMPEGTKCFITGKPAKRWVLWGRSY